MVSPAPETHLYWIKKCMSGIAVRGLLARYADTPQFKQWVGEVGRYANTFQLGDHMLFTSIRLFATYLASQPVDDERKWACLYWHHMAAVWIATKLVYEGKTITARQFLHTLHRTTPPTQHVGHLLEAEMQLSKAINFEFDKPQQDDCLDTLATILHITGGDREIINDVLRDTSYGSHFITYTPLELTAAAILQVLPKHARTINELVF